MPRQGHITPVEQTGHSSCLQVYRITLKGSFLLEITTCESFNVSFLPFIYRKLLLCVVPLYTGAGVKDAQGKYFASKTNFALKQGGAAIKERR